MLNKVKIGMLVGIALSAVRFLLPDLAIPEGLDNALVVVIAFVVAFFVKETPSTVRSLTLR